MHVFPGARRCNGVSAVLLCAGMILSIALCPSVARGADLYVWTNSPYPGVPYNAWSNAARSIQDAVDVAQPGDTVRVTNGIYASGSRTAPGDSLPNRVVVTNSITVVSVNGPPGTTVEGEGPIGSGAVRCIYASDGFVSGFTLTNGCTRQGGGESDDFRGGGVFAEGATISNCVISGNHASRQGGGVAYGIVVDCTISGNDVTTYLSRGGGVFEAVAVNCDIIGNVADAYGGGAASSVVVRCTVSNNAVADASLGRGGGIYECSATNSLIVDNQSRQYGGGAYGGSLTGCRLSGNVSSNYGGGASYAELVGCALTGNTARLGGGSHQGTLIGCTNINNIAENGGGAYNGIFSNCTIVANRASDSGGGLFSAGEARNCVIIGNSATNNGGGARSGTFIDCLIISNNANMGGGLWTATPSNCVITGNSAFIGGGAYQGTLRHCVISNNTADYGGGTRSCWERDCRNVNNRAAFDGGGAYMAYMSDIQRGVVADNTAGRNGGGVYANTGAFMYDCVVVGNAASNLGGGTYNGILEHCTVVSNIASTAGGSCTGCVLASILYYNIATVEGDNYFNVRVPFTNTCTTPPAPGTGNFTNAPRFFDRHARNYHLLYGSACIDAGETNTTFSFDMERTPRPLDGNYDGTNTTDAGAYEYNPATADSDVDRMPDWWEHKHRLNPTNSADAAWHADADNMDNLGEYAADTDPTNTTSVLCLTNIAAGTGVTVWWCGGTQAVQYLQRRANLVATGETWTTIFTNLPVTPPSTNFPDTTATNGRYFYRIKAVRD